MPEETWALQVTQWGKQSVLNTPVPATVLLQDLKIDDEPLPAFHEYGPAGQLANVGEALGLVYSTHKISGKAGYNEIAWPIAAALGNVTPTVPVGGTNSRKRIWTPVVNDVWTPLLITQERGDLVRGRRYADLVIKGIDFTFGPDKFDLSGDAFAGKRTANQALTASLVGLLQVPILGENTKVYLDATNQFAGSPTQLTRYFEGKWGLADIYAPEFPGGLNAAGGYGLYVQLMPKMTGQLTLEADSVAEGIVLNAQQTDSIAYLRIEATGPIIEASINYKLTIDTAIKFTKESAYKAVGKASALLGNDWPFVIVKDPAWTGVNASGQFAQITLINKVPTF